MQHYIYECISKKNTKLQPSRCSHPRLSPAVTLWGAHAIAGATRCKDAAAIPKDRNAPRLVHCQPDKQSKTNSQLAVCCFVCRTKNRRIGHNKREGRNAVRRRIVRDTIERTTWQRNRYDLSQRLKNQTDVGNIRRIARNGLEGVDP